MFSRNQDGSIRFQVDFYFMSPVIGAGCLLMASVVGFTIWDGWKHPVTSFTVEVEPVEIETRYQEEMKKDIIRKYNTWALYERAEAGLSNDIIESIHRNNIKVTAVKVK